MIAIGVWGARYIVSKFFNNPILFEGDEKCGQVINHSYKCMNISLVVVIAAAIGAAIGLVASRPPLTLADTATATGNCSVPERLYETLYAPSVPPFNVPGGVVVTLQIE